MTAYFSYLWPSFVSAFFMIFSLTTQMSCSDLSTSSSGSDQANQTAHEVHLQTDFISSLQSDLVPYQGNWKSIHPISINILSFDEETGQSTWKRVNVLISKQHGHYTDTKPHHASQSETPPVTVEASNGSRQRAQLAISQGMGRGTRARKGT